MEELQKRIDEAILEIECEIERYDGSNEDFISASWVEMEAEDYVEKLQNYINILKGKKGE